MIIKNPYDLLLNNKYKITYPCYDDYNEGLKPEIEIVKVIYKYKDGYIFKNKLNIEYNVYYNVLKNCKIEQL